MTKVVTIGDVAKKVDCHNMWATIRNVYNGHRISMAKKTGIIDPKRPEFSDFNSDSKTYEDARKEFIKAVREYDKSVRNLRLTKDEFFALPIDHLERINYRVDHRPMWRTGKKRELLRSIFDEYGLEWVGYETKDPDNPWFDRITIRTEGGHSYTLTKEAAKSLGYI